MIVNDVIEKIDRVEQLSETIRENGIADGKTVAGYLDEYAELLRNLRIDDRK